MDLNLTMLLRGLFEKAGGSGNKIMQEVFSRGLRPTFSCEGIGKNRSFEDSAVGFVVAGMRQADIRMGEGTDIDPDGSISLRSWPFSENGFRSS